ncbi:hypothetical protein N9082_01395, partial [Akkermansiaceae bacterium]|nr:hypothetical protein [Akkermansiaceae bacterium]
TPEAAPAKTAARPSAGEMADLDAADRSARLKEVGRWAVVKGRVIDVDDQGEWIFESEKNDEKPLKARVGKGFRVENIKGKTVSIVALLETADFFIIEKPEDLDVIVEKRKLKAQYTLADEKEIRTLEGETIKLRAEVVNFHESDKNYYLEFTKDQPKLAGQMFKDDVEGKIDAEFLESLEGKTIAITGAVVGFNRFGGRFEIQVKNIEIDR